MRRQNLRLIVQKRTKIGNYKLNNAADDLVKVVHKYICAIIDSYCGELIGCKASDRIDSELAIETLRAAISRNQQNQQIILHTDQGAQYRSNSFAEYAKSNGII